MVVVTRAADAHLLRLFLASRECFWEGGDRLVLFTCRADSYLWEDIRLPAATRLVYREDFPELGEDDFRNQLYLKLTAHRFVETENYVLMDSDFLFVAPCPESSFFHESKPVWFRRAWNEGSVRWREGSEAFVGASIDHLYMTEEPQYVFSRAIAAELCRRYDPRRIVEMEGVSEFVVYGWFANRFFPDSYRWVDLQDGGITPVGRSVNQIPPSYCELDPTTSLDDFPRARYVAFWSHWDLAETKMVEFLLEAHRRYPDRPLHFPELSRIYPLIHLPATPQTLYSNIRGLYSDGWVKDEVWFAVAGAGPVRQARIYFDVPRGPATGTWQLSCGSQKGFRLDAGLAELTIPLDTESARHSILLRFDSIEGGGETDATGRGLRARLLNVSLDDQAIGILGHRVAVTSDEATLEHKKLTETIEDLLLQLGEAVASGKEQRNRNELLERAAQERLEQLEENDRILGEMRSQLEASVGRGELLEKAAQERLEQLEEKDRVLGELRSQLEASVGRGELLEKAAQERLEQLEEKGRVLGELRSQLEASVASEEEQRKQIAHFKQVVTDNEECISRLELTRDQLAQQVDALKKRVLRFEKENWRDFLRRRLGS